MTTTTTEKWLTSNLGPVKKFIDVDHRKHYNQNIEKTTEKKRKSVNKWLRNQKVDEVEQLLNLFFCCFFERQIWPLCQSNFFDFQFIIGFWIFK